eukprot:s747_g6.t1
MGATRAATAFKITTPPGSHETLLGTFSILGVARWSQLPLREVQRECRDSDISTGGVSAKLSLKLRCVPGFTRFNLVQPFLRRDAMDLPPPAVPTDADAVASLERGFQSFRRRPSRSRSPAKRKEPAVWPEAVPDFYEDAVGLIGVKDNHGALLEEAFPVDVVPLPRRSLHGAASLRRRRFRHWAAHEADDAPPRRRFFRKVAKRPEQEFVTSPDAWQAAAAAAAHLSTFQAELPEPDFLPIMPTPAQLRAPSWGTACRNARLAALRERCQKSEGDATAWLDFAEFQWSQVGEELSAPPRQVREKQRAVLEAALAKQPGAPDVRLIRALAAAEADGAAAVPVQDLLAARRQRLLQCSHAEVAEELVWGFLEACMMGGAGGKDFSLLEGAPVLRGAPTPERMPAPVETVRKAVMETLTFLEVRKAAAGHDGQAVAALERAELAAVSCCQGGHKDSRRHLSSPFGPTRLIVNSVITEATVFIQDDQVVAVLRHTGSLRDMQLGNFGGRKPPPRRQKFIVNKDCEKPPCSGQVHIQLGGPGEMVVVFASQPESVAEPLVRFGKSGHSLFDPVIAGGREMSTEEERYDSPAIHTVVLTGLEPGVEYTYQVDSDGRKFSFKMPQEGQHYPYKVGLAGDIGQTPVSNSSFHLLQGLKPELVLLTGDLSYADGFYPRWDSYGIMAEPLNARVPEAWRSFSSLRASENLGDPNYWSRDIGPMHVVALNSYAASGPDSFQFNWLKKDLEAFSRKRTPWLVVMMHAPFYNSNLGHLGEAAVMMGDLEELFYKHGVNVVLAGHVHSYERTWPVYKSQSGRDFMQKVKMMVNWFIFLGDSVFKVLWVGHAVMHFNPLVTARNETTVCAPVYVNIGDGGNREGAYAKWLPGEHGAAEPTWSAFRQGAFGMAELELSNETHAQFLWKRNACFDNGEVDFHPENCTTSGDNSKNAVKHDDISWIVRSTEACPNQA